MARSCRKKGRSMKRTVDIFTCDVCKQEKKTTNAPIIVYRTFDSTDGRSRFPRPTYHAEKADLCDDCLRKIAVVQDVGVQCVNLKYAPQKENEDER